MKTIRETWILFLHYEKLLIRNPYWVLSTLFEPICYLYLFAPLLKNISGKNVEGDISSINIFAPGLLVMVSLYGVMFVGYGMLDYLRSGVIERLRVTTVSRLAILLGLVMKDATTLLIQTIIVILLSIPLGLKITFLGMLLIALLTVMVGLFMSPISYALALTVRSEDALGPILNTFAQPMLLLSGVLLPLTLAPSWLKNISAINPLKYVVDASRAIFSGDVTGSVIWQGYLILAVLVVISFWWSLNCIKKATE